MLSFQRSRAESQVLTTFLLRSMHTYSPAAVLQEDDKQEPSAKTSAKQLESRGKQNVRKRGKKKKRLELKSSKVAALNEHQCDCCKICLS